MFKNNKCASIIAIAALTASGPSQTAQAIRAKADAEWHLAMVPDGFDAGNRFISAPGQSMGFGFSEEPMFNSNFGFGGNHFGDMQMPSFGSHMGDMFRQMEQGPPAGTHGNSWSSSSSSSYSSEMGADGKKHERSSKQGEQKVCQDGKCKIMRCENGNCQEATENQGDAKVQNSRADNNQQDQAFRSRLADQERAMGDDFANMHQRMRQMEEGFANMERNMAESFREMPMRMNDMFKNGMNAGEGHTQSYSSSFQESTDKDGKVHKKEQKQGQEMECSNGVCKGTVCENGACHEVSYEAKHKPNDNKKKAAGFIVEEPKVELEGDRPEGLSKEEFMKIMQKLKEHMEKQGKKGGDVVVKIVPMKGNGPAKKEEDVPPPKPEFAPKN